jgi:hypothetical protein
MRRVTVAQENNLVPFQVGVLQPLRSYLVVQTPMGENSD